MTLVSPVYPPAPEPGGRLKRRKRKGRSLSAAGEPMVWLCGGMLVVCIAMIAGLLAIIGYQGLRTFIPRPVVLFERHDGTRAMGEVSRREKWQPVPSDPSLSFRQLVRTGNFEMNGTHYKWIADRDTASVSRPEWALVIERTEWGRFYGFPRAFVLDGEKVADSPEAVWRLFTTHHATVMRRVGDREGLEKKAIGSVNRSLEAARLALRKAELRYGEDSGEYRDASGNLLETQQWANAEFARITNEIRTLNQENARYQMILETADGRESVLQLDHIVRAYPANRLGLTGRAGIYLSRWREFLLAAPREANSEGGVFPAIWGTVVMTLLMTFFVAPFGVMAALYLREYAKAGPLVSAVRIAVNNLAGVPSIVFGIFGLGFFCYIIGASIDQLLFAEKLPTPTYGTGGLLWASLTLALLTLPVVIVASEEALAAVPGSMREGSYACGASKWQTIRRIVLPRAMPGIMTGMILAMARGAGEVAPLMLVGAVKLAPALPLDTVFPYIHPERSFMHLGFHIYDLGFQSQNSEAAKPVVFTTTLLLVAIIAVLNITAIYLRGRLRKRFAGSQF